MTEQQQPQQSQQDQQEQRIQVRAHQSVAGVRAGETGWVPDDDYTRAAIDAGKLERVTEDQTGGPSSEIPQAGPGQYRIEEDDEPRQ